MSVVLCVCLSVSLSVEDPRPFHLCPSFAFLYVSCHLECSQFFYTQKFFSLAKFSFIELSVKQVETQCYQAFSFPQNVWRFANVRANTFECALCRAKTSGKIFSLRFGVANTNFLVKKHLKGFAGILAPTPVIFKLESSTALKAFICVIDSMEPFFLVQRPWIHTSEGINQFLGIIRF